MPYNDYGSAMRRRLGGRVQKIAVDARLGCPNRDGRVGVGGCTFCLNEAFSPGYCRSEESLTKQIDAGLQFHASRGRMADINLAYFQSGSNTYASVDVLRRFYDEALSHRDISGIIVGTRPDCVDGDILQLLHDMSLRGYVALELGIESTDDATLEHVNRGHSFAVAASAVAEAKALGIDVGAHFILGLPGRDRDDMLGATTKINSLGLDFVKFHQLQIYRSTPMAQEWEQHPERFLFGGDGCVDDYVDLVVEILRRLDGSIAVERFVSLAPRNYLLHSPLAGLRPDEVRNRVIDRMLKLGAKQGDKISARP